MVEEAKEVVVVEEPKEPEPVHVPATVTAEELDSRLARHKGELQRMVEEYKTADVTEKTEMRNEIDQLKAQLQAEREAKEAKEKDAGTGGTLVLPPEQVPQGQEHGDRPGDKPATVEDTHRDPEHKRRWHKVW